MEGKIETMQRIFGYEELQKKIDSGAAWKSLPSALEAIEAINEGACMLGKTACRDFKGHTIPSRGEARDHEIGSAAYCREYWRMYWRMKTIILSN